MRGWGFRSTSLPSPDGTHCVGRGDGNDWYPFLKGRPLLTEDSLAGLLASDSIYFDALDAATRSGGLILDAGCGSGARVIAYALDRQQQLLLLDRDPRILGIASNNLEAAALSEHVDLVLGNLFELRRLFHSDAFDVVTHHGVLEHYSPGEIRRILSAQLLVAPRVVCAVPVDSPHNRAFFRRDGIRRNLWCPDTWLWHIVAGFRATTAQLVRTNKDELIFTLNR